MHQAVVRFIGRQAHHSSLYPLYSERRGIEGNTVKE